MAFHWRLPTKMRKQILKKIKNGSFNSQEKEDLIQWG